MGQCRLHVLRKQVTAFVAIIHHVIYFMSTLVLNFPAEEMETDGMQVQHDIKTDFDWLSQRVGDLCNRLLHNLSFSPIKESAGLKGNQAAHTEAGDQSASGIYAQSLLKPLSFACHLLFLHLWKAFEFCWADAVMSVESCLFLMQWRLRDWKSQAYVEVLSLKHRDFSRFSE